MALNTSKVTVISFFTFSRPFSHWGLVRAAALFTLRVRTAFYFTMLHEKQTRAFKGIWIPAEMWERADISMTEKCLLAEIESLDQGQGCYASDDYLAGLLGLSVGRFKNILVDLRKRKLIETIASNGRQRWMRQLAYRVTTVVTDSLPNHVSVSSELTKPLPSKSQNRDLFSNIEDNKDESKDDKKSVPLSDEEWMKSLSSNPAYEGIDVPRELARCSVWCEVNREKYSRRRIVNWLNRQERPMKSTHKNQPGGRAPDAPAMR